MHTLSLRTEEHKPYWIGDNNANLINIHNICQHRMAHGRPASYVSKISEIFDLSVTTMELCIVVPLPDFLASEVPVLSKYLSAQARLGFSTIEDRSACALIADGRVALSMSALKYSSPERFRRIVVVWLLKSEIIPIAIDFEYEDDVDFWLTSWDGVHSGPEDGVIEVAENFEFMPPSSHSYH